MECSFKIIIICFQANGSLFYLTVNQLMSLIGQRSQSPGTGQRTLSYLAANIVCRKCSPSCTHSDVAMISGRISVCPHFFFVHIYIQFPGILGPPHAGALGNQSHFPPTTHTVRTSGFPTQWLYFLPES